MSTPKDTLAAFMCHTLSSLPPHEAIDHLMKVHDFSPRGAHALIRVWWELSDGTRERLCSDLKLMRGWILQVTGRR